MSLLRRTFKSIRTHRNYRLYFFGQIFNLSGTWMQNVALYWLILNLTGSAVDVGLLSVALFGPVGVFGLFTGVVADRFDNRKTVMVTQGSQMVLSGVLAGLTLAGVAVPWEVYVIATLNGTATTFDQPVRQNLIVQMVGRAELPNAVALNSSLGTLARTVGPALAGVVIATLGVGWCFALNTASFLGVLAALVAMRPREFFHLRDRARPTLWRGTWEGIVYAAHTRRVIVLVVVAAVVMSFALNVNVLLPVLAKRTLDGGPQTFGTISACFGLGALLGALISATIARPRPQIILGAAACCGLTELVLAPIHGIALACILLAVCGFCFSNFAAGSYALLQLETPDYIRGRVLGIFVYGWNGPPAFISPLLGFLCTLGGTELAFVVSGVLAIFVASAGALALLRPAADNGEPAKPLPQTS